MNKDIYKMRRTFNPIGQGAFYTEKFGDDHFIMVYDCGSNTKGVSLDEIMDSHLPNKKIDLLVISHFHADHISGLEYLLKTYDVKKIMLPLLHPAEKIDVYLYNERNKASEFILDLCLDPIESIKRISNSDNTKVVYVLSETGSNESRNIDELDDVTIRSGDSIIYTCRLRNLNSQWCYIPFNFEYTERSEELKKLFTDKQIPLDIDTFKEFYQESETNRQEVKRAYENVTGDLNTNSLVLYSGVSFKFMCHKRVGYYSRGLPPEKFYMRHDKVSCLYLGDYNAEDNWEEFEKAFKKYFRDISVIQIPHHGSNHNYNEGLNFQTNIMSVISAGKSRKLHPHPDVLKKIILNNGIPILVTEDEQSTFIQTVSLYL